MFNHMNVEKIENGWVVESGGQKSYHNDFGDVLHGLYVTVGPNHPDGFIGFLKEALELVPEEEASKVNGFCGKCGEHFMRNELKFYQGRLLCHLCFEAREKPQ